MRPQLKGNPGPTNPIASHCGSMCRRARDCLAEGLIQLCYCILYVSLIACPLAFFFVVYFLFIWAV